MGLIILFGIGLIVGWAASVVTRTRTQRGFLFNIAVGIAGALLTGLALDPFVVGGSIVTDAPNLRLLALALAGPVVLLAATLFLRRRTLR